MPFISAKCNSGDSFLHRQHTFIKVVFSFHKNIHRHPAYQFLPTKFKDLIVPVAASLAQTPGVNSFERFGVSPRAIRLHVGLEDVETLWADLEQALAKSLNT